MARPTALPVLLDRISVEIGGLAADAAGLQGIVADLAGDRATGTHLVGLQKLDRMTQILEQLSALFADMSQHAPQAGMSVEALSLHSLKCRLAEGSSDRGHTGDAVLF